MEDKIIKFRRTVLDFWEQSGRKDLPWRLTSDPWHIILAEILLRKTASRQVVSVYQTLSRLSPYQIACMSVYQLEALLRPLGMHRIRARQLISIASAVEDRGVGALSDPQFLAQLPGIGQYISNAVLCFAFGFPKPTLDTNMIRVLTRVFGIASKRSRAREDPLLWRFAEMVVPYEHSREFNWGILDLAAVLCKARDPKCKECPFREFCNFYLEVEGAVQIEHN